MSRRSLGMASEHGLDGALDRSQPSDVAAGDMPSPEARKPSLHQRLPVGVRQRAQSAAVALFKRARGRTSGTSSQEPASMPAAADASRSPSAADRPRSASQPDEMPDQAAASMLADRRSESMGRAEAGSAAEPAAKRRRTGGAEGAEKKPLNGNRLSAAARFTPADRTASDASALSSQEPDNRGPVLVRNGSSLGSRRHGAGGLRPKGGAGGRRRLSSEGSAAAPITSLIEACGATASGFCCFVLA